ncbi:helix-turn-helix domain-containing protein [Enterococcus faecalis]|uniref:helix-turn-helix domain-containing protein n=1 Tax=Enterococcus faecalis TaxID=1351 RepID=UPI000FCB1451|nr:helix-turn-helix domain-containing protein [Enterococcus faecalis]
MAKYTEWLTEEGLIKIEGWARDGLIDKQIAQNIGVAYSTFRDWVKKFPALSASLKRGKEVVDRQVENALFKSATGYEYTEVTEELTEKGMEITKKVTKQVAPNPVAAIFWLKNRKPDEWRDRKETEVSGVLNISDAAVEIEQFFEDDST